MLIFVCLTRFRHARSYKNWTPFLKSPLEPVIVKFYKVNPLPCHTCMVVNIVTYSLIIKNGSCNLLTTLSYGISTFSMTALFQLTTETYYLLEIFIDLVIVCACANK